MLSSGKQNNFSAFSLPASPVTVRALCSFGEYYNAAVTCTRCLTTSLLQTPSNQHLLWQGSHVHNVKLAAKASCAKRTTCNRGVEEEQSSTGQGSGHFCSSHGCSVTATGQKRGWKAQAALWWAPLGWSRLTLLGKLPSSPDDYRFVQAQEPGKHRCFSSPCLFYAVALQIPLTQ